MKRLLKQGNTSKRRHCLLALGLLCAANFVVAQEQAGSKKDVPLKQRTETKNVLMGSQDAEVSVQAVSTASGDRLQHRPVFNMESTLDGVLPGLYISTSQGYPTENRSFRLRGNTPIILVDGVPRSDANIPVSQIESVSVIKDGLGLSMLGMSSGNGVVYIKTKRGGRTSLKIGFTAQLAFNQQIFRPEFLNAYQYAGLLNEALLNDGKSPMYSQTDLELYRTGASPYTHPDVDWQDQLLRNSAPIQQYNLNMSGGGKVARYFIDLNVYNQDGFLKQDNSLNSYNTRESVKKYSLRTNTDINITDHTLFKVNVFGQMYRETTPGKMIMSSIYRDMYATPNNAYPVFNPNGTLGGSPIHQTNNLYGQTTMSGYYLYPQTDFNIDATLEHRFQGALKGLYASATYSYNSSYRESLNRSKNLEVWSYWKDPTDPNSAEVYNQMASAGSQENKTEYSRLNRMQYLDFAIGYDFNIKKNNFRTKILYTYNDYTSSVKNIPLRKNSVGFRAEYDYDKRYMAEFALAGMNLNTLKPGDQWGIFPSVGAGWNIHKEEWFNIPAINMMKLRATFGMNGNDGTGAYYRSSSATLTDYYYTYLKYYKSEDKNKIYWGDKVTEQRTLLEANMPYLSKWEKITRWNVGLDLQAFNRSLSATVEFFHNTYSDVLQKSVGKDANHLIGLDIPKEHLGKYRRSGIELDVTYNKRFGDVSFVANANALFYKSKLLANGENAYPESYMQRVGEKYSQIFGYVADGLFQSQKEVDDYLATTTVEGYKPQPGDIKYRDLNGDHLIDGRDVKAIGNNAPLIEYGVYLAAEWKGLAFSMQWSGLGNSQTTTKMMPFTFNAQSGYGQALVEHLDRWTPDNPNARYPKVSAGSNSYNERTSTFWLQNSSYLRLKNVELSYTLPKVWTSRIHLDGVKFFVNGYNLVTISGIKDRDPEILNFLDGTTKAYVPNSKAYNFGINIQF